MKEKTLYSMSVKKFPLPHAILAEVRFVLDMSEFERAIVELKNI